MKRLALIPLLLMACNLLDSPAAPIYAVLGAIIIGVIIWIGWGK